MRSAAEAAPSFLYLPALALAAGTITLAGDDARYVARVVRARDGERIIASDGEGTLATLVVESTRPEVTLSVSALERVPPPPASRLLCGAPEGERGDWLVEKLAELGVTEFQPVDTERVRWPAHLRIERWERLAIAALRQSRSAWRIRLQPPVALADAVARDGPGARWLAEPGGRAGEGLALAADEPVSGAVGPSSGFSDSERKLLSSCGFEPVRLAPLRLRTETAALALAALWATRR